MPENKDIITKTLSVEDRQTLIRVADTGQALNRRNESAFLTVGIGREQGTGVSIYTHTEVSRTQLISLLAGFISLLEENSISIVKI
jgi:hypothetical protein